MSVLFLAAAIYLYLSFLGWGLTRIALPRTLSQYRAWFAPWTGMMLAAVLGVRLSRLGMGAAVAIYPITVVGAGFGIWSALLKPRSLPRRGIPLSAFVFACLVTLLLALYPLLYLHDGPTTVSLGNTDPGYYAAVARFLEAGSIRRPPVWNVSHPLACLVDSGLFPKVRPGTFLLISLLAGLFHVQAYEILTVLLAVVVAVTPPMVGIFVRVASANRFAALVAMLMSALSVNQLYFFYHGFAGQIFGQGCLIIAFILLWKAETDQKHWFSYAFALGLTVCAMLELYQEDVPLFLIPCGVYFILQLLIAKTPRWRLVCRYALVVGIVFALDPFALWYCLVWLWSIRALVAGWPILRWALPTDIIGLANVYLPGMGERVAAIASIPVGCLTLWGFLHWRNPRLTLSVTAVLLALLFYAYASRHFSYGYHKLAADLSFLLIGAFATGVAQAVKGRRGFLVGRYAPGVALTFLAAGCFLTAMPLIQAMKRTQLFVGPDLVELTAIKQLAGNHSISLIEDRCWQQLWAVYFLGPIPTLVVHPSIYFTNAGIPAADFQRLTGPLASPNVLTLVSKSSPRLHMLAPSFAPSTKYFSLPEQAPSSADRVVLVPSSTGPSWAVAPSSEQKRVLWQNSTYLLLGPESQRQGLGLSGQTADGWITSEGLTLDVPGEWVRLRPIIQLSGRTILFEHLGGNPNVNAKLYLAGQSPKEVPATINAYAGDYALRIELNPADLPSDGEVHLKISFDKYFVPEELGLNSDARRLVIMMPEKVSLL
jgi:hypothetical protein